MMDVPEVVSWIDADGAETVFEAEWATSGRFASPVRFEEDGVPEHDGLRLRAAYHDVREFVIPVWITADDGAALRAKMRAYVKAMNPRRGPGVIRVLSPGGDVREIDCIYAGGLEMDEELGSSSGPGVQKAAIVFRAHNPHWRGPTIVDSYEITETPSFFPIFPLRLTASEIAVDTVIDNTGDMEAWPVWHIYGPGTLARFVNDTTGEVLSVDSSVVLSAGDFVKIDTRPFHKTITSSSGANLFPHLSKESSMWPLIEGMNRVRLEMAGALHGVSRLQLSYNPRFLTV